MRIKEVQAFHPDQVKHLINLGIDKLKISSKLKDKLRVMDKKEMQQKISKLKPESIDESLFKYMYFT